MIPLWLKNIHPERFHAKEQSIENVNIQPALFIGFFATLCENIPSNKNPAMAGLIIFQI